jgi:hypothetical protein
MLHLPPLRFHCVGGCWDRTQDCCDFGIGTQTLALTTRLDLIHYVSECPVLITMFFQCRRRSLGFLLKISVLNSVVARIRIGNEDPGA